MEFKGNPIITIACYRLFGDLNFMVNPRQQATSYRPNPACIWCANCGPDLDWHVPFWWEILIFFFWYFTDKDL